MTNPNALLHRRDVVNELLRERGDLLVIAGLGAPNWDVSAAGDSPNNFPLWGAMGAASMMGLGLALAQPHRKVLVITGDGEMLMSVGALATIAVQAPRISRSRSSTTSGLAKRACRKPTPPPAWTSQEWLPRRGFELRASSRPRRR